MSKTGRGILSGPPTAGQSDKRSFLFNKDSSTGNIAFNTSVSFQVSPIVGGYFVEFPLLDGETYLSFQLSLRDLNLSQQGFGDLAAAGGNYIDFGVLEISGQGYSPSLFRVKSGFLYIDSGLTVANIYLICSNPRPPQ